MFLTFITFEYDAHCNTYVTLSLRTERKRERETSQNVFGESHLAISRTFRCEKTSLYA